MMRSTGPTTLTLPPFAGSTRKLVLVNLGVFFVLAVLSVGAPALELWTLGALGLTPALVLRGFVWQPLTYSFMNVGLLNTAFSLLAFWFTGNTLEEARGSRWLVRLYYGAAIGGGVLAVLLSALGRVAPAAATIFGASTNGYLGMFAPLFAVLVAFAMLFGDVEFLLFFVIRIKAKYMVAIMVLWRLALLLRAHDAFSATVELCCGLIGFLYVRYAQVGYSSRPATVGLSERYFGLRNDFYRWKRRRAAKKFEVYMRKQDREVKFDNEGRYILPEDEGRGGKWMN